MVSEGLLFILRWKEGRKGGETEGRRERGNEERKEEGPKMANKTHWSVRCWDSYSNLQRKEGRKERDKEDRKE